MSIIHSLYLSKALFFRLPFSSYWEVFVFCNVTSDEFGVICQPTENPELTFESNFDWSFPKTIFWFERVRMVHLRSVHSASFFDSTR